jgi:hypothetical protein
MADPKMHQGGCHCGAVRYRVELDLTAPALSCNCSMCGRAGTYLMFVPADKFTLEKGEGSLTDYQFNRHVIHHLFCKTCGIKPFARGKNAQGSDTVAVNVRTLDDIDVFTQPTKQSDGKSR